MIQNHVVNLDLAQQLYEAGIKIEREFWWCGYQDEEEVVWDVKYSPGGKPKDPRYSYPAPLSSELGELLPKNCSYYPGRDGDWCCHYQDGSPTELSRPFLVHREYSDTEANARAKMLLYLKEKGLL